MVKWDVRGWNATSCKQNQSYSEYSEVTPIKTKSLLFIFSVTSHQRTLIWQNINYIIIIGSSSSSGITIIIISSSISISNDVTYKSGPNI